MYNKASIQKVKETTDLTSFVSQYIELKKQGTSLVGECPSCQAKKKFTLTPSKKIFKCFSCGKGGNNALKFLTEFKGIPFLKALED